jgi:hypothetical protein
MFKMDNKIKQPSETGLIKITPNNQVKTLKLQRSRQQQPDQPQKLNILIQAIRMQLVRVQFYLFFSRIQHLHQECNLFLQYINL